MPVRRERAEDVAAVEAVTTAAFAEPGKGEPVETRLLRELRADAGWLPAYSLVAEDERGGLVGHVVCTRGDVDGAPALGLGPISVAPAAQRAGVGSALMRAVLAAAGEGGETLVCLVGDPAYYGRFGFTAASGLGVASPEPAWGAYFQALALAPDAPRGTFAYAAPFGRL
ncbi:MAG: N-acetyltransferase [Solirubrobacteraceae bacterium]